MRFQILFIDNQIKLESFVEDVKNLLNTFEVSNIFPTELKTEVIEMIRPAYQSINKEGEATLKLLYSFFQERVKKNLHIVLCMSPIGDAFRTSVRIFPSLVNCCIIVRFNEWSQDALVSVVTRFLKPVEMDDRIKQERIHMVQFFHQSTIHWAKKFYDDLKHKYSVTISYLELIVTFKALLDNKRNEVTAQIYAQCVEKSISSSQIFSLLTVQGEPVKIRAWNIDGLPSNQFSIGNSIILFKARRRPFCIDLQGQANKWIKKMEQSKKIAIIKLLDSDFINQKMSFNLQNQFNQKMFLKNLYASLFYNKYSLKEILLISNQEKALLNIQVNSNYILLLNSEILIIYPKSLLKSFYLTL